jgi:hypothetical protein
VDVAELERVFGLSSSSDPEPPTSAQDSSAEQIRLHERVRYLELQVDDLKAQLAKAEEREAKLFDRMPVPWWRRLVGPKE